MELLDHKRFLTAWLLAFGLWVGSQAMAQPMGRGMHRMPVYDPKTEVTVTATVVDVLERTMPMGFVAIHLAVRVGEEPLEAHLGPKAYVSGLGMEFQKGDVVQIIGSRQTIRGVDSVLAREIKKGEKTITLRDENGAPRWPPQAQRPPARNQP